MPNALRTKMQSIINAVAKKVGKTGYYNPSSIESDIEGILTDENANNLVVSLLSGSNPPETLIIPNGITKIRAYAIPYYRNPRKIIIPNSVTEFGTNPIINIDTTTGMGVDFYFNGTVQEFFSITRMSNLYSGENTSSLFINNEKIEDVIVDWDANFSKYAFSNMNLNKIIFKGSVKSLNEFMFDNSYIKEIEFEEQNNITTFPNNLFRNIGEPAAAQDVKYTKKIIFPPNLLSTGDYCFNNSHIGELVINEGLKYIGGYFLKGTKIDNHNINIPSSVISVGREAFRTNDGGYTYIFNSDTPPTIASYSNLFHTTNLKIYVPLGKLDIYKSHTNLTTYASYMLEKNQITLSVPSGLLNNEQYTYSIDNGETWLQFDGSSITLAEVANIIFKNTDANTTILVGTTSGGSDIGTIANAELNYNTAGNISIYLTIQ